MKIRLNKGIGSFIGALLLRCAGSTWRISWEGMENLEKARERSSGVIFALWHGRLALLSWPMRKTGIHVLASENYDGDLAGRIAERIGFGHLKGSTSRGGARALRQMRSLLIGGSNIALAVDGPRGPRGVVQQGAIELSRLTGSAIVPLTASATRRRIFGSWDRLQFPGLFSRVTVAYGTPIFVGSAADPAERDRARSELQEKLNSLTTRLDIEAGHSGPGVWPHENS